MKRLVLILFTCLTYTSTIGQEDYTKSLDGIEWVKIESKSDVIVKTHSSNLLLIKSGKTYVIPEKAKGLKLVGEGGSDNTDVGFYVIKEGNDLIVRNLRKSGKAEISLPATQNISVNSNWNGDIEISGFKGEIEANANLNGGIAIKDVSGPITAYALNEDIEVSFTKINQSSPITISTTNGELDITLPGSTPADISLSSLNGEIYTNFDLSAPSKDGLKAISTQKVNGTINNGGVKIQLNSINGNIYLRKQ